MLIKNVALKTNILTIVLRPQQVLFSNKLMFAVHDIMSVTGHKNVASLNSYLAEPDMNARANM